MLELCVKRRQGPRDGVRASETHALRRVPLRRRRGQGRGQLIRQRARQARKAVVARPFRRLVELLELPQEGPHALPPRLRVPFRLAGVGVGEEGVQPRRGDGAEGVVPRDDVGDLCALDAGRRRRRRRRRCCCGTGRELDVDGHELAPEREHRPGSTLVLGGLVAQVDEVEVARDELERVEGALGARVGGGCARGEEVRVGAVEVRGRGGEGAGREERVLGEGGVAEEGEELVAVSVTVTVAGWGVVGLRGDRGTGTCGGRRRRRREGEGRERGESRAELSDGLGELSPECGDGRRGRRAQWVVLHVLRRVGAEGRRERRAERVGHGQQRGGRGCRVIRSHALAAECACAGEAQAATTHALTLLTVARPLVPPRRRCCLLLVQIHSYASHRTR